MKFWFLIGSVDVREIRKMKVIDSHFSSAKLYLGYNMASFSGYGTLGSELLFSIHTYISINWVFN